MGRLWGLGLGAIACCIPLPTLAQTTPSNIVPDDTLGDERSQVNSAGAQVDIIQGGAERGINLFHSFREFSVGEGRRVDFIVPNTGIQNILARVTGNSISNIDGLVGVNGNTNLFFLNPNGIVFGPNARLQVGGTFLATTASSFRFPDGSTFGVGINQVPNLLMVNVPLGLQVGPIGVGSSIVNQGQLSTGQDLTLNADKLSLEGSLQSGRDLTLKAQDTVKIRDTVAAPFSAKSGQDLTIQGNQGIDILAFNTINRGAVANQNERGAIQSGRNLKLISNGVISGDAHFSSGSMQISSLSESLASFTSLYDPIISSRGDVDIAADYTGASLLIESLGSVRIRGAVKVISSDTASSFIGGDVLLSNQPGLIIRSGQPNLIYNDTYQNNLSTSTIPDITLDQPVQAGSNVKGGIVKLTATNGSITTDRLDSSSRNPGIIELNATGNVTTGGLINNSGIISVTSDKGAIRVLGALSSGSSPSGGNIQLLALGDITVMGPLYAQSLFGNRGGDITLVSKSGSIDTSEDALQTFTFYGPQGGNITMSAYGDITTADLLANGRANAGAIQLTSYMGRINTQKGFLQAASAFGQGGAITLSAFGGILTDNLSSASATGSGNITLSTTGKNGEIQTKNLVSYAEDGDAGNIRLSAVDGNIETKSLISSGKSKSGDITISTQGDFVSRNSAILTSTYGYGASGNIGITSRSVSLIEGTQVSTATSNQGAGGSIKILSDFVKLSGASKDTTIPGIEQQSDGLFALPDNPLALPAGAKISGYIPPASFSRQFGTVAFPSGLYTQTSGTTFDAGRAGDVVIKTARLVVEDRAAIAATTFGQGNAGNIQINALNGSISLDGGSILSGVAANSLGESGIIDLQTRSFAITRGGRVQTQTLGKGKAGNIQINAINDVSIVNEGSAIRSGSGAIDIQNDRVGESGDIRIVTPRLSISDDAVLSAETFTNSKGGDLFLTVNTFNAARGGQLRTTTNGTGQAGIIRLDVTDDFTLSGANTGLFANTVLGSSGNGGSIFITPRIATIQDSATIAVTSQGLGTGGSITLQTDRLNLSDVATITAETSTTGGGNIILNANQLLLLRRNSLISTTAGKNQTIGSGNGGNITLKTPLLIAIPGENSDIAANATKGNGGKVDITANLFGIQPRPQRTPLSDITASSETGIQGSVAIATPDVDPSRGLQQLSTAPADPSNKIDQSCSPNATVTASQFTTTGKSGLPSKPDDRPSNSPISRLAKIPDSSNTTESIKAIAPIIEAQSALRLQDGKIRFLAAGLKQYEGGRSGCQPSH